MIVATRSADEWLPVFAVWRPPFSRGKILTAGLLAACLAAAGYYGIYLRSIAGEFEYALTDSSGALIVHRRPWYWFDRNGNPVWSHRLANLLEPAHRLDRLMRPKHWQESLEASPGSALSHPQ